MSEPTEKATYLTGDKAEDGRVPFQSRGAAAPQVSLDSNLDADGRKLPSLADFDLRLVLLLTLVMQSLSWWILGGYQLADSIEYVENAQALVHGTDVIDSHSIRSYFFPALLAPILWLADVLQIEDPRPIFGFFRLLQMFLGLALVSITARIGARIGGRGAGLAAALFVAANPVFLQYSVSPIADIAAALCVAKGVEILITGKRRQLLAGVWLGMAIMCAYKTLPLVGAVGLVQLLRAWRQPQYRGPWMGLLLGVLLMLLAQSLLDLATYGRMGYSLKRYFFQNFGPILAKPFYELGMMSIAKPLYALAGDFGAQGGLVIRGKFPPHWYVTQVHQFYVGPLVVLLLLGLGRAWRKPSWRVWLPIAVAALYVAILSTKGAKDYRLWIPILGILTPTVGMGWCVLWGAKGSGVVRKLLAMVCLVLAVGMGLHKLQDRNTRQFSGYWEAIDWLNAKAAAQLEEDPNAEPMRVASAYNWAVFMREGPGVTVTKLPHQLDGWQHLSAADRRADLFVLLEQDWLILHEPVLRNPDHDDLLRVVGRHYVVEAVLWDRDAYEDLGPILIMRREHDQEQGGERNLHSRTLYGVTQTADMASVESYSALRGFDTPMRLVRPELGEDIWCLGFEYETLPPHGHGWITYHFYNAGERPKADYMVIDRLTTFDQRHSWQNNHPPAWGVHPTNTWEPGAIVRESSIVVACEEPYKWRSPYLPMGGAYRRGDLIPADLWLDFVTQYWRCNTCGEPLNSPACCPEIEERPTEQAAELATKQISGRLERARFGAPGPLRRGPLEGILRSPEGWQFSQDDLNRWGSFFMPVHEDAKVPDDGRPIRG
ncbi:MAG: hypothetical protein ACI8QC_002869 [Planctomycetota bacterium]